MNKAASTKQPAAPEGRTLILLTDVVRTAQGSLFAPESEGAFLLKLASLLAGKSGRVVLCSLLQVPQGEAISSYSVPAQSQRQRLEADALSTLAAQLPAASLPGLITPVVKVVPGDDASGEVRRFLQSESSALLLLPLRRIKAAECPWLRKAIRSPLPCDVAWARPPTRDKGSDAQQPFHLGMNVLLPARGGPQAMLALELTQALAVTTQAKTTILHVMRAMPENIRQSEEAPFSELLDEVGRESNAATMPKRLFTTGEDPAASISKTSRDYDLLIMGAGGEAAADMGRFTEQVARNTGSALIALKTRKPVMPAILAARKRVRPHTMEPEALSMLVDKWFAENTFHANEFSDLGRLVDIKRQRGLTISVGLPALNEEATIGQVITSLKSALMIEAPLIDELVLIDSDSTDNTREIAAELGISIHRHSQILPEVGSYTGKGEALWKSLHILKGDIIAWVDTDVANMQPQFVYGLVGPLLREPRIGYVKGYYHRPIKLGGGMQHEGGGRVTELTVRPLLNLFFPLLSGLVQPLAGEYAGRRDVLEKLPFFTGYGVETGLLIDMLERYGLNSIGQVNLESRVHRNRSLADLSLTAFAIVQVILTRLEERARISLLEEVNRSMKLILFEKDHLSLQMRRVRDEERPPIASLSQYSETHGR
ncbi:MAG: glucosyl-3-phosphoglycerate synthase [Chloroflexota bacterium]|nr:glucosyl-3-phosphoglycerate synthase [Chloroflexota bacterium]